MNAHLEMLAGDKEMLLLRSADCRLRLRGEAQYVRDSLHWRRAAVAAASSPATRQMAFGIVLSFVGLGRAARIVMLASRIVLYAKVASSLLGYVRKPVGP